MMNKTARRFIVLLLLPGFLADPTTAAAFSPPGTPDQQTISSSVSLSRFHQEALAVTAVSFMREAFDRLLFSNTVFKHWVGEMPGVADFPDSPAARVAWVRGTGPSPNAIEKSLAFRSAEEVVEVFPNFPDVWFAVENRADQMHVKIYDAQPPAYLIENGFDYPDSRQFAEQHLIFDAKMIAHGSEARVQHFTSRSRERAAHLMRHSVKEQFSSWKWLGTQLAPWTISRGFKHSIPEGNPEDSEHRNWGYRWEGKGFVYDPKHPLPDVPVGTDAAEHTPASRIPVANLETYGAPTGTSMKLTIWPDWEVMDQDLIKELRALPFSLEVYDHYTPLGGVMGTQTQGSIGIDTIGLSSLKTGVGPAVLK